MRLTHTVSLTAKQIQINIQLLVPNERTQRIDSAIPLSVRVSKKLVFIWKLVLVVKNHSLDFQVNMSLSTASDHRSRLLFFYLSTVKVSWARGFLRSAATDCERRKCRKAVRVAEWCSNWAVTSQWGGLEPDSHSGLSVWKTACSLAACATPSGIFGFPPRFKDMQVRLMGVNGRVHVCLSPRHARDKLPTNPECICCPMTADTRLLPAVIQKQDPVI